MSVPDIRLDRREVLQAGAILAGAGVLGPAVTTAPAQAEPDHGVATNISAAVSPDRRWLALDLVCAIWVVPAAGGAARRLTGDDQDATQPHWSPDSTRIAFQSYRDGNYHLWVMNADGTGARPLTGGPFDHREPKFSPDGRHLAFASDRAGGSYGIYTLDLATGAVTTVVDTPAEQATPAWSPDGRRIAYTVDDAAIDVVDVAAGTVTRAVTAPAGAKLYGPAFAPDGTTLSYVRVLGAAADLIVGDRQATTAVLRVATDPTEARIELRGLPRARVHQQLGRVLGRSLTHQVHVIGTVSPLKGSCRRLAAGLRVQEGERVPEELLERHGHIIYMFRRSRKQGGGTR